MRPQSIFTNFCAHMARSHDESEVKPMHTQHRPQTQCEGQYMCIVTLARGEPAAPTSPSASAHLRPDVQGLRPASQERGEPRTSWETTAPTTSTRLPRSATLRGGWKRLRDALTARRRVLHHKERPGGKHFWLSDGLPTAPGGYWPMQFCHLQETLVPRNSQYQLNGNQEHSVHSKNKV